MVKLFVDSSCDYLSLLLTSEGKTQGALKLSCGRRMNESIMDSIGFLFEKAFMDIEDIDELYAVTGPGSFTGVRIGVAAVLGLSAGLGKPCFGITSLDAAAAASGLSRLKCASRLKGDIFALREYDFKNGYFSPYYCGGIEGEKEPLVLVNTDGKYPVDLERAVTIGKAEVFRGECAPLYLRKSEAEINIDKKSRDRRS